VGGAGEPLGDELVRAKIYCQGFSAGGYTGWRLPTKEEPGALHQGGGKNFISVGWDAWSISESSYSYAFVYFFSYGAWAPRERGAFVEERNGKSAAFIMGAAVDAEQVGSNLHPAMPLPWSFPEGR
jgi:hypothetical protein